MKQFILFVLVLSLIFVSCNNNNVERPKKPKNLIKKEMMANILYDMSILTASKGVNKKYLKKKVFYQKILFLINTELIAHNLL